MEQGIMVWQLKLVVLRKLQLPLLVPLLILLLVYLVNDTCCFQATYHLLVWLVLQGVVAAALHHAEGALDRQVVDHLGVAKHNK